MLEFTIPNISCGHCVRAVTEAVYQADPQATVQVDLATQRVLVQTQASRVAVAARLAEAGYTPAEAAAGPA